MAPLRYGDGEGEGGVQKSLHHLVIRIFLAIFIYILQIFFEIRHDRFCQKLTNELRSSTPVLFLRLVPVKEVVDVIEAENVVPLSAAKRVKPLEDESVSECIELAELEKYEAVELRLRRIAFTNSKSSPMREKRPTRSLTSPCPNSVLGFDSSTCL